MEQSMEDHTEGDKFIPPHDEAEPHRHTYIRAVGHGSEHGVKLVSGSPLNLSDAERAALPALVPLTDPNTPNVIGESIADREES